MTTESTPTAVGSKAELGLTIKAKPLEWDRDSPELWTDKAHGFSIQFEPDDEEPYSASWGESDSAAFRTLDEAKAWCQQEIDEWVSRWATGDLSDSSKDAISRADLYIEQMRQHALTLHAEINALRKEREQWLSVMACLRGIGQWLDEQKAQRCQGGKP